MTHTLAAHPRRGDDRLPAGDPRDLVVLLDAEHRPIGTAARESVHGRETPLHLAFSCWLLDDRGRVLMTRRALTKRSWPGVWTNSFCGHPRPDEPLIDAVRRHGRGELGLEVDSITPLLPDFDYRAVDASGIVEHEFCPVFVARATDAPDPHPDEVVEHAWVEVDDLRTALTAAPWALSPWLRDQAAALDAADAWPQLAAPFDRVDPAPEENRR
ncbi:isopentenyl-diphosphate Delta-isomerase [Nocardioides campestrisoli]|uniref:isopentenyl-diphosphate Delta-isomerase n=1 Tax=Nocardioides campestrisoli TaxID=2736757 RepID=UPI00163DDC60|nr:isopentenyl-diphosphate Delta-isomerase [Nocardioides campestrisoli]